MYTAGVSRRSKNDPDNIIHVQQNLFIANMGGIVAYYKETGDLPKINSLLPEDLPKLATLMMLKLAIEGDIAYFRKRNLKDAINHLLKLRHRVVKMISIKSEEPDLDELVS